MGRKYFNIHCVRKKVLVVSIKNKYWLYVVMNTVCISYFPQTGHFYVQETYY